MPKVIHIREVAKLTSQSKLVSVVFMIFAFLASIFSFNFAFAEDLNYSVSVEPALNITTSASKVSLDLNPLTKPFDSQDLNVSVSTNNSFGYHLNISTANDVTTLLEKDDPTLTIPTLDLETTEDNFTSNRWGYKLKSSNEKYFPFASGAMVAHSYAAVEDDTTTMTFAAKADYGTKAGTYTLALNFQAVSNPDIQYMQTFTAADCKSLASSKSYTVYDLRDGNDYQVRYINNNCWMVQNLRYLGDNKGTSNMMVLRSATSNVEEDKTISYTDLTVAPYNSADDAKIHNSGNATNGVWYNYAAASAGTITGGSKSAQVYDVCPNGWRLPTLSQARTISSSSTFSITTGGDYYNGSPIETNRGYWWTGTVLSSNGNRYSLTWHGSGFQTDYRGVLSGNYIRCVRST